MSLNRAIAWNSNGLPVREPIPHNPNYKGGEPFVAFSARVLQQVDGCTHVGEFDNEATAVDGVLLRDSDWREWVRNDATNLPTAASVAAGAAVRGDEALQSAIAAKKAEVDALYQQKIAVTSWTNSADSTTYSVQSGDLSQQRITGRLSTAHEGAVPIKWRMADNSEPTFNLAEFTEMTLAVAAHVEAVFFAATGHKDAIAALPTIAAVDAYNISANWPA